MFHHLHKKKAYAFTLVELLVVIAILGLLLSVIIPALQNARLLAKQVVCASMMRQWTLATIAYASQNDDLIAPYADTCDTTNGGNALNFETYWYNRLSSYLTTEYHGQWGMDYGNRRCPMARANWGEQAVWIGVYYSKHTPENAPYIFLNSWNGSTLTQQCRPFNTTRIKQPSGYLSMLDVRRDRVSEPSHWNWGSDYDGDGMNDSHTGILSSSMGPYNGASPKIHRGGCNVALFDGHVEWIRYETFWEFGSDGYPVHPYWWNANRP